MKQSSSSKKYLVKDFEIERGEGDTPGKINPFSTGGIFSFEISSGGKEKIYRLKLGEHDEAVFVEGFHPLDLAIRTVYGKDLYTHTIYAGGLTDYFYLVVRLEKADEIYEMAMRAIKSGRLKAREVDQSGEVLKFSNHRVEVPFEDFLDWALSERISVSDPFSQALGFSKYHREKFHPKKFVLLATAQVIWYYEQRPIAKLGEHPLMRKMFDQSYCRKNSFRNIVKLVDPRPQSERGKPKATKLLDSVHYPPKPIPGISRRDGNFLALKTACKALFNALKHLKPSLSSTELLSHPLVELCLVDRHEIIKHMAAKWLAEVNANFPLCLHDF